ncbi:perilipin-1 isoform X1 [Elephas maximus indicus]|uniref:perilipin-1 isoform X1 n=1 Tax=Elephas maximus indicus TaxID=99487 RepID=UPI002116EC92|nr:perilipin-1 isoform X1 [Elephas maximus indicus]XP_049761723.1 perilipin-1 isoform X1 [Elephas maximus indicus]XP_049761725.1 perilipin-1 isoform X1 [Elephas maximus indicus]XP_049761726.1 perilipin-1 isoform X1 [Elephas maximus indicus]
MAVNKSPTMLDEDLPEKENVIQRVLQLPVVSGTCECFQKTYASTKESHPLVASVCNAYEKGVQGASNLAAWSMEPVVRRLSTQFIAANDLACRGLDHLEEKIPALQYPPEKIASELKDTISTRLRSARNSISVPITSTSDKVLGAALAGCELALGVAKDTAEFAANTRAGRLASGGADLALGGIEKMVEFLLPPAKEESASDPGCQRTQKKLPKGKPSLLSRVGALANTLSHHTFQTTAWALKQGTDMALWIPGVAPLSNLAQWGASAAMQAVSRRQSGVPWLHNIAITQEEDHNDQNDTEGEETEEEEEEEEEKETEEKLSEVAALPSPKGLLGSVAHTMQMALQSSISAVTWAPATVLGMAGRLLHLMPTRAVSSAKGRAMSLSDALKGVTDNVVDTVVHYVPLPRLSLMEPESEFRDIDNPPAEAERRGSGARATGPECLPRPALYRSSLRNARGSGPSQDDKLVTPAAPSPGFPAVPREKPTRRVSDSFFRPSVMEPILGRAQYGQLRKKS